jgi:hypothetical protein
VSFCRMPIRFAASAATATATATAAAVVFMCFWRIEDSMCERISRSCVCVCICLSMCLWMGGCPYLYTSRREVMNSWLTAVGIQPKNVPFLK